MGEIFKLILRSVVPDVPTLILQGLLIQREKCVLLKNTYIKSLNITWFVVSRKILCCAETVIFKSIRKIEIRLVDVLTFFKICFLEISSYWNLCYSRTSCMYLSKKCKISSNLYYLPFWMNIWQRTIFTAYGIQSITLR